jgi:serine phosphatase RsbU (regulator of sigma subunit)
MMRPVVTAPFEVISTAVLTGLTAMLFIYVAAFHRRWFPALIVVMVGAMFANAFAQRDAGVPLADADPRAIQFKLLLDGIGCLLGFVLSYTCFMGFIGAESSRHARVVAEMELAREIHGLLVPAIAERHGRYEFYGVSRPSAEVGGDLVDVVPSPAGWVGYVADVSGHGVGAGLLMGITKSAMRTRVRGGGSLDAALTDVNCVLHPLRKPNMFVTLAAVQEDGTGPLAISVAGHPPILHYRAASHTIEELSIPQVPLGIFEDRPFASTRVAVDAGDLLAVITDGLTEVFDRADEEFGLERLKQTLQGAASRPLASVADAILGAARAYGPQSDDQTLLLIRRV